MGDIPESWKGPLVNPRMRRKRAMEKAGFEFVQGVWVSSDDIDEWRLRCSLMDDRARDALIDAGWTREELGEVGL